MSFTVNDFNDFKELLALHPDWQVELRRMIVGSDLESLPSLVRDLLEAHQRGDERLARLEEAISRLEAAQSRSEQRLTRLEEAISRLEAAQSRSEERLTRLEEAISRLEAAQARSEERLTRLEEAQVRTEERLARLEEAQVRTEERLARMEQAIEKLTEAVLLLEKRMGRMDDRMGRMDGQLLETRYRERAGAYFGRWMRRTRVVDPGDLADELRDHLSPEDFADVLNIDLVVRGRPVQRPDLEEIWLAVEVSFVVDRDDVARAVRRADLIRRTGRHVLPVVAGKNATQGAETEAAEHHVLLLHNGSSEHWEEALAAWIK